MAGNSDESYEWVELLDPKTQRTMYVNLNSGECCWEPPKNRTIKPLSSDQWWELFDVKAQRNYYYNSITRETVWQKPSNGDIIPLANLQLLQQNMQQTVTASNPDIGILRRSNSKVTAGGRRVHNRKMPTSVLEGSSQPVCEFEQFSRNESRDSHRREDSASHRALLDPTKLAEEQLHRLSTQNVGPAYRPYGNQRVRDWLLEAGVAWEHRLSETIQTPGQTVVEPAERKNAGCFSDRPTRRIHSLTNPKCGPTGPPADQSSSSLLTPNTESATLESMGSEKPFPRTADDAGPAQSETSKANVLCAWIPDQPRNSSGGNRAERDLRSISGPSVVSIESYKSVTPSFLSGKAESARVGTQSIVELIPSIQQHTSAMEKTDAYRESGTHLKHFNGQQQGLLSSHPIMPGLDQDVIASNTRQRAFPRTNPTVSRPATSGTATRSIRFSATTLDRPVNSNHTSVGMGSKLSDQRTSSGSASSAQRNPAFNVIHFSNTDLRGNTTEMSNGSSCPPLPASNTNEQKLQSAVPNDNLSLSGVSFPVSKQAPTSNAYCQPSVKTPLLSSGSINNVSSVSTSPQPSSSSSASSSSSFSRASSGTALTNTDSEDNKEVVHSAPNQIMDAAVHAFQVPRRASLNPENKSPEHHMFQPQYNVDFVNNQTAVHVDPDQPPIPPPRSASTLGPTHLQNCTSDFYRLSQSGMFVRSDPYVLAQRPYTVYYPQYPHYMPQQQRHIPPPLDGTLIHEGRAVSSLSRKDPARANVIPPNHRRPPPFLYQPRPVHPIPSHPTVYYIHPFDGFVHDSTVNYATNSTTNHRLSATSSPLLPSTGVDLCNVNAVTGTTSPSTATTWVSHSTATWDLEKLRAEHSNVIPTSDAEQLAPTVQLIGESPVAATTTGITSNITTTTTTTTPPVLQRSPSGGFIGPEELNDSMWFSNSDQERSSRPAVPFFTLVQPGHPQFPSFTAPFDWPRTLFKPDQDIATLMSWTKSKFSKRLLLSTESNMKKQVADTFKIVQSSMGDRKLRLSLPNYGSIIVHRALTTAGLRDEIFAQLCKQTTGNPDIKSLTNGWALICVCLYYFPPNSKFRDALLAYLTARADASVCLMFPTSQSLSKLPTSLEAAAAIASGLAPVVSELKPVANGNGPTHNQSTATIATTRVGSTMGSVRSDTVIDPSDVSDLELATSGLVRRKNPTQSNFTRPFDFTLGLWDRPTAAHFARVAPRWFVRSLNVGPRKLSEAPSTDEICHVKDFILKPSIFGGTLVEMMRIQAYRFPHLRLPWVQIFLTEELLRLNGPVTEGIFRLSPDVDLVTEIRCQLEKLFEIFRVVHVCALDPENNQMDDQQHPPECFRILRPPPAGWSLSLHEFQTESPIPTGEEGHSSELNSAPLLNLSVPLTGAFTWPLIPARIVSPPTEYVLLTPTDQWPRSLSAMATRLSSNSAGETPVDPHLAAGLLKLWLREMADPLVPIELQPECLKAACEAELFESQHGIGAESSLSASDTTSDPNPIQACCLLVRKIPPLERRSLLYLILLLQHLAKRENASRSLMDPRNLATVIAPNLMRSNSTNPRDLLENVRPQTLFVRLLISYLDVDSEVQYLWTTEGSEEEEFCNPLDINGMGSKSHLSPIACSFPVRVRLGPDNRLLPV